LPILEVRKNAFNRMPQNLFNLSHIGFIMKNLTQFADTFLNPLLSRYIGFRIIRSFPTFDEVRNRLIKELQILSAIDGGANQGQWAMRLRGQNKEINIFSFEPVSFTFEALSKNAANDTKWEVLNFALGEFAGLKQINLSDNLSMSASIKDPLDHLEVYPSVKFENSESIKVIRLDESGAANEPGPLLLKLDVQGFELEALKGARLIMKKVALIEIETSFREMYTGEVKHTQLITWLESEGFTIYTIAPPAIDKLGRIGYLDCLLLNTTFEEKLK